MELTFLGTGAADVFGKLKEDYSFGRGDKNVRRYSSTLLDGMILFDCSIFTVEAITANGADLSKIKSLFITHFHGDHCDFGSIQQLAFHTEKPLDIYYSCDGEFPFIDNAVLHPLKEGETVNFDGYSITPFKANHNGNPFHYSIEKDGKKIFYGLDGAWLLFDTYYAMKDMNYDAMILDATVGDYDGDYRMAEHNSIPMIRMMVKSFNTFGIANENTKIILSHLARTLHVTHAETEDKVKGDGFIVAFDGMKYTL